MKLTTQECESFAAQLGHLLWVAADYELPDAVGRAIMQLAAAASPIVLSIAKLED